MGASLWSGVLRKAILTYDRGLQSFRSPTVAAPIGAARKQAMLVCGGVMWSWNLY
jgi:hypothetical protein